MIPQEAAAAAATTAVVSGTTHSATDFSDTDGVSVRRKGLARKLSCSVVFVVFTGVSMILFLQVGLLLTAVPNWWSGTEETMMDLEQQNMEKLSSGKAEYVTEIFARLKESTLQAQTFAKQILLDVPEIMVVENYLKSYSGLDQEEELTTEHSVWFITTLGEDDVQANSSLEGLLNRSSLMDVTFRGIQGQHKLVYLAALDDPSAPTGTVSDINMQSYPGENKDYYVDFADTNGCNGYDEYEGTYNPVNYDPRCRKWYQEAIADDNTDIIFTNPYNDAEDDDLTVTIAAPVYDSDDATLLLGVVGVDMVFEGIKDSILNLTIIDEDNSYAYLLAPGSDGEVAVHRDIDRYDDIQFIDDLEGDRLDEDFDVIINTMSTKCSGSTNYFKNDENWLLAWNHETASVSGTLENGNCEGFTVVVTVSEATLIQEFSQMKVEVSNIFTVASVIMAAMLLLICICAATFAVSVSNNIVKPVNQLIDVTHSLYTMDFSKKQVGPWMVNKVSSSEVEKFMDAFETIRRVVKAANVNLKSGNLGVAEENYTEALVLFNKLDDDRGVAIIKNNLGTVFTLQAQELESNAVTVGDQDPVEASRLNDEAKKLYSDAIKNYMHAIHDAKMLCAAVLKNEEDSSLLQNPRATNQGPNEEMKTGLDMSGTTHDEYDRIAVAALFIQLSNRTFNLAVCHASRGACIVPGGSVRDPEAIAQARELLHECVKFASKSTDEKGDACRVRCLLELAILESHMQQQREVSETLDKAEKILVRYRGDGSKGHGRLTASRLSLVVGLPQRLLAARGAHFMADGNTAMAIASWTHAIIGSGDKMDVTAVESSLNGLRDIACSGRDEGVLPSELLVALGLPAERRRDDKLLVCAINEALANVNKARDRIAKNQRGLNLEKTSVDLCFIMDCTGSMKSWVNQAKTKLLAIIEQAKADVGDLNLRVGFIGYRDYGDRPQYEGPYDFHTEQELPDLITKLKHIKAFGGTDFPEDIAGGLDLAFKRLSWESHIRLCILIADAPCHGNMYHSGLGDRFPDGDKKGLDPAKMLYDLKYELGVDLYFIKITDFTDKMMRVFQTRLANLHTENKGRFKATRQRTDPEIKVHDLGSDDNRFLEAVVESVKSSVQMSHLLIEE